MWCMSPLRMMFIMSRAAMVPCASPRQQKALPRWRKHVITESDDKSVLNKRPVQVPRHSGSLWADYRFHGRYLDGALIGAGVRYLGATQGDNTNSFTVPAVWLGDLSLRYQINALTQELSGMELGITISNIANTSYVAGCTSSTYCSIGNDRTVVATLNYFF